MVAKMRNYVLEQTVFTDFKNAFSRIPENLQKFYLNVDEEDRTQIQRYYLMADLAPIDNFGPASALTLAISISRYQFGEQVKKLIAHHVKPSKRRAAREYVRDRYGLTLDTM